MKAFVFSKYTLLVNDMQNIEVLSSLYFVKIPIKLCKNDRFGKGRSYKFKTIIFIV